ncbi:MAG: hypothetical protein ABIO78_01245 [Thermoanaerobaculia bacterium]
MSKATTGGIVAGLLLLILGLSLGSVWLDSTTSDEIAHIAGGMVKVLHGQLEFHRFQPPFWDAVIVVPIILDGVRIPPLRSPETANAWSLGRHILYRTGHDATGCFSWRVCRRSPRSWRSVWPSIGSWRTRRAAADGEWPRSC